MKRVVRAKNSIQTNYTKVRNWIYRKKIHESEQVDVATVSEALNVQGDLTEDSVLSLMGDTCVLIEKMEQQDKTLVGDVDTKKVLEPTENSKLNWWSPGKRSEWMAELKKAVEAPNKNYLYQRLVILFGELCALYKNMADRNNKLLLT